MRQPKKASKRMYRRAAKKFRASLKRSVVPRNRVSVGKGLPKQMIITQKYREVVPLNSVAGSTAVYSFSCNSIYDPNYTGTGHQPMYFDQLGALYDHYCVIGSKIRYKIVNASVPVKLAFYVNDDSAVTPTSPEGASELTSGKLFLLPASGTTAPLRFTGSWSAKKYFGKGVLANTELQGTTSSNPTEQSFYTLVTQSADLSSNSSVYIDAEIDYIVVWKELKDIGQS